MKLFGYIAGNGFLGDNVIVKQGAKILENTHIGDNSIIRENSVIGGHGFGVEKDEEGNNLKIPHFGGVIIGDNVEIGALNTVVSGTINPTVVEDYVKVDDYVHIAHNCKIGKNSIITAGVIFSGSVKIGENVWVGSNSTIKNSISINDDNLIGIGTVITKDICDNNRT
ncbi:MAG: DapH/DapD/GlmU-related protein [Candidatus Izemoplasmataceae bacterium]